MLNKLQGLHNINTPLYNPNKRNDNNKINHYIQENFLGNELEVVEELKSFITYYNLSDMLDFSRKDFNKQINLSANKKTVIISKWQVLNLGSVVDVKIGGTPARENASYFNGNNLWVSISEMKGKIITDTKEKISDAGVKKSNVKLIPKGTTLLSFKLSIGKTAIAGKDLYTNEAIAGLIPKDKNVITDEYLYQLFSAKLIDLENIGSKMFGKSLNSDYLKNDVKIPIPPKEVQKKITDECNIVQKAKEKAILEIEKAKKKIDDFILNALAKNYKQEKISSFSIVNPSKVEIRTIDDNTIVSFVEMASVSENGIITNTVDKPLKVLRKGSYTYFRDNDIIIAKITPCMENGKCALAKGLSNGIGMGSSEFHVIRTNETMNNKFLFSILNRAVVRKEAEKNMTGSSGHRRVPASYYENFKVPVLPIREQEKIVRQIEILENTIIAEQAKIDSSVDKKKEILKKYL